MYVCKNSKRDFVLTFKNLSECALNERYVSAEQFARQSIQPSPGHVLHIPGWSRQDLAASRRTVEQEQKKETERNDEKQWCTMIVSSIRNWAWLQKREGNHFAPTKRSIPAQQLTHYGRLRVRELTRRISISKKAHTKKRVKGGATMVENNLSFFLVTPNHHHLPPKFAHPYAFNP